MEFWPEFLATSGGREFLAGGVGGMAGVLAGHPLDTLRIRLQQPPPQQLTSPSGITAARAPPASAAAVLRGILCAEGPAALYRGMSAPLASVAFQVSCYLCLSLQYRHSSCPTRSRHSPELHRLHSWRGVPSFHTHAPSAFWRLG